MKNTVKIDPIEKELMEVAKGPEENLDYLNEFRIWNILLSFYGLDAI